MSTQLKFTSISVPIQDIITGELIHNGYQLYIPYELFKEYKFNTKLKLYCPTVNFFKSPFVLHAWSQTYFTGQIVKKETHIHSIEWAIASEIKQSSAMYWPQIQQSDIEEFRYCMLFVIETLDDSDEYGFILEIDENN
jgi:hypothetical protein